MAPNNVIIVGGSIAGLLHGIQLKRQGSNVMILEQDPSSDRHNHQAGIALGPSVVKFLAEHDTTGQEVAVPAEFSSIAWRTRWRMAEFISPRKLTSWGLLYRILRANFDGWPSPAVPSPPPPGEEDGRAEYCQGKRVTGVRYDSEGGLVSVQFVDVTSGEDNTASADLVIGADGVHSTLSRLVEASTERKYAGYVAWRGTLPERQVSAETARAFSNRVVASVMKSSYMIIYVIPTDDGDFGPGERTLNWVWYHNVAEDSAEMASIFTDIDGKVHRNTVPSGLVRSDVWERHVAAALPHMSAPVAELVTKTSSPFVTKVNDAVGETANYYDGHLVLVGDALAAIRPHTALATEQAAKHCLGLAKVWAGEATLEEWDRDVTMYGKRMVLLSRVVGLLAQGTVPMFVGSLLTYLWFLVRVKLGLH